MNNFGYSPTLPALPSSPAFAEIERQNTTQFQNVQASNVLFQGLRPDEVLLNNPMNETIYDDGKITVTPTEIRAKGFVLYADKVASITVKTVRPAKWLALLMTFPVVIGAGMFLFLNRVFGSLLGQQSPRMSLLPLILLVPICFLMVLGFLLRVSQLFLQTSGGPVMLASKMSLTDPRDTMMRYERIKQAIEKAKSLRKRQTSPPT